jgi:hypothetical protein
VRVFKAAHPVVVLFNARGDYLLNLPALRALSHLFGERLTVICRPYARHNFFPKLRLRGVCEPPTDFVGGRHVFAPEIVADAVAPVDLVLSLNPWHDRVLDELLAVLQPTWSMGYHDAFDQRIPLDRNKHDMDQAFDLPRALDDSLAIEDFADPPDLLDEAERIARELRSVVPQDCRLLALHTETKPEKMWPAERFSAVLDWLLSRDPDLVVAEFGWEDAGLDYGRHSDRIVRCRLLPLPLAMAFVGTADLFLGVDSCFLHAADLFRVPSVGLFGPSRPHEFGFRFAPHRHVDGNGRMEAIMADSVIEAIESLEEARSE